MPHTVTAEDDPVVLGKRLLKLRKLAKLTRQDLADFTSISPSRIWEYETGKRMPTLPKLCLLLSALRPPATTLAEVLFPEAVGIDPSNRI